MKNCEIWRNCTATLKKFFQYLEEFFNNFRKKYRKTVEKYKKVLKKYYHKMFASFSEEIVV